MAGSPKKKTGSVIIARKAKSGPMLLFNGKSFANTPDSKPKIFATPMAARKCALQLRAKFPVLKGWTLAVGSLADVGRKKNPSARENELLDIAARKLEDFSGHPATDVVMMGSRSSETTGLIIGELDLIGYTAKRDGKTERYGHKFRKSSRPLLSVTSDGKQLHVVGGRYEFTEAGIEDR